MSDLPVQLPQPYERTVHLNSPVEEWILYAQEKRWEPGSSPTVFVTYTSDDSKWVGAMAKWLDVELRSIVCRLTGMPYAVDSYSGSNGTADGRPFPPTLAEKMWRCRAAIVVASQEYFNHPICHSTELRFLAWRQQVHGIRLWVLRVGTTSSATSRVSIPRISATPGAPSEWPDLRLDELPHDGHPKLNAGQSGSHDGTLISLLPPDQQDLRLTAFAEAVAQSLRESPVAQDDAAANFRKAGQLTIKPIPDKPVGDFPPVGVFEGRHKQRAELFEAATGNSISVAGIDEIGGQGKTTLCLKFKQELKDSGRARFQGYFAFTFYGDTAGDKEQAFADALTQFLVEELDETPPGAQEIKSHWLWQVLRTRPVFLLLDGLETIQAPRSSHEVGAFPKNGVVLQLLSRLCLQSGKANSFALLTSRLPFRDLNHFRSRFLPIALGGLSAPEGAAVLRERGGVEGSSDAALEGYSRDLDGHPLGLLAFAISVHRTASSPGESFAHSGAVAAFVAREAALAQPGTAEDKVRRMLEFYRGVLTEPERKILEVVAADPDGLREDWLKQVIRDVLPDTAWKNDTAAMEALLSSPALRGVLQSYQEGGRRVFTCHPIIRQSFRPQEEGLARSLAKLHLSDRPPGFIPKTLAHAKPYLKGIATLASDGQFREASKTLVQKLDSGDLLLRLGGERELFDCLMQFVGPERRDACEKQLGGSWFNAMLPRVVDSCIALNEWKLAQEFNALDRTYLRAGRDSDERSNRLRQSTIEAEIGSIQTACNHLASLIRTGSTLEKIQLLPQLAECERYRGRPEQALAGIRDWLQIRPESIDDFYAWFGQWDSILAMLAQIGVRASGGEVKRYLAALNQARFLGGTFAATAAWHKRYLDLVLRDRDTLSRADWQELLDLAEKLGRAAESRSLKGGKNSWMQVIIDALNGLGPDRAAEALEEAKLMSNDMDESSWRGIWLLEGIARAHLLLGEANIASDRARLAMNQAQKRSLGLLASQIAKLMLEICLQVPDQALEAEARGLVETYRGRHKGLRFPEIDVFPGEPGWDAHISDMLLECAVIGDQQSSRTKNLDQALGLAAQLNLTGAIAVLLEMGASQQASSSDRTPLRLAIAEGSDEAAAMLLNARPPIDLSDEHDRRLAGDAIMTGRTKMIVRLLQGARGLTPETMGGLVATAVGSGSDETLELLLEMGAGILENDQLERLAQIVGAATGNRAFLERISDRVDLSRPDNKGVTPLMAAAQNGHLNVIDFLAEIPVDALVVLPSGETALEIAADFGQVIAMLRLARRFGLSIQRERHLLHGMIAASSKGWDADIAAARDLEARFDERDDRGWTGLTAMSRNGQQASLEYWLPRLSVNEIDACDSDGETSLMAALASGHTAIVELLLKNGVSVEVADAQGRTAFDLALSLGQTEGLALLMRHSGSYPPTGNIRGAISSAIESRHSQKLAALIQESDLGPMLARAIAKESLQDGREEPGQEVVEQVLAGLQHSLKLAESSHALPQRHPRDMTDEEVDHTPCVVGDRAADTFGRLNKSVLPDAVTSRLPVALGSTHTFDAFDASGARGAELPFLPGCWLLLLPHKTEPFEVPLILTKETVLIATTSNQWLYQLMGTEAKSQTPDALMAYVRFFLSVVTGNSGAFFITHDVSEVLWEESADVQTKDEFARHARELAWVRQTPDGRQELRGTVLFKNALFETSVMVNRNWELELSNEELRMEELPVKFGRRIDILVRY